MDRHWQRAWAEYPHFWQRIPETTFAGLKVLEFGCGLGGLSLQLAQKGAAEVLGLEIEASYCAYARQKLNTLYPDFNKLVSYTSEPLESLPNAYFDMIISKDVLEHVIDLETVFPELVKKVKPGGDMFLGFGPLWYSSFGDHGISALLTSGVKVPWLHLWLGEKLLLRLLNKKHQRPETQKYKSLAEAG